LIAYIYQYSETNVMHLLFILFRINRFYMFRAYFLILRRRLQAALGILLACFVS
jgi:hypothetical protein